MLRLNLDGQGLQYPPYEAEMRRRLWWQILLLDMQAAEDWGCNVLISDDDFNTYPPTNVDDGDIDVSASSSFINRDGFTQITFGLMFREAGIIVKLFHVPTKVSVPQSLQDRMALVVDCQKRLNKKYLQYCNSSNPLAWVTHTTGRLIIYKAWLLVHYPIEPQDWKAPQTIVSREHLLLTSVTILELSFRLESNEDVKQWWWFFKTYVQWHALAVTLVELSVQFYSPLIDRAWTIVDTVFELWGQRVVDTSAGYVWLPIKTLYARAHKARNAGRNAPIPAVSSDFHHSKPPAPHYHGGEILDCPNEHDSHPTPPNYEHIGMHASSDFEQCSLLDATINLEGWDHMPLTNSDDNMDLNWSEWDQFVQEAGGLLDLSCMP